METLTSLFFLSTLLLFSSLIALKFRFPAVIILILLGMLIGPKGFGIIENQELINLFAEIGGILLLFFIGLEFNFSKILKLGLIPFFIALIKLGIVFLIVYQASLLLSFSSFQALFLGLIISVTSTALTLRLLKEMKLGKSEELSTIVGISIIEDVIAIFLMAFISGLATGNLSTFDLTILFFKVIGVLGLSYWILSFLLSKILDRLTSESLYFLSFTLILGLVLLASLLKFSPSIGAFIAGSLIASTKKRKMIEEFLKNFGILFVSIFFLSIGMLVDPKFIFSNLTLILIFTLIALLAKFVGISFSSYFFGFSGLSATFIATSMLPLGEVSLLIAKEGIRAGILSAETLSIISSMVVITSLVSYPAILFHSKIYTFLSKILPKKPRKFLNYRELIYFFKYKFIPPSKFFELVVKSAKNVVLNLVIFSTLLAILLSFRLFYLLPLALIPIYFIIKNLIKILKYYSEAFNRYFYKSVLIRKKRLVRDFTVGTFLIFVSIYSFPLISYVLGNLFASLFFFLTLFISFYFLFDLKYLIKKLRKKK